LKNSPGDGPESSESAGRSSVDLQWFIPGIREAVSGGIGRRVLEQKLSSVRGALDLFPPTASEALELTALHALLWEAERRLAGPERAESDFEELAAMAQPPEGLDVPSLEEKRGAFLGEFLNDAVRDFRLEPMRFLMDGRFDRGLPGLRPHVEEMARLAGFFASEPPADFVGIVERAMADLPVLAMGLVGHPSGVLEELLGERGKAPFADAVLHGRVAREDEFGERPGLHILKPSPEIAMMQRRMEATERQMNPGGAIDPNLVGGSI
jgi:hypothetical protein